MSDELKPCPFCAGKPYAQENGRMGFRYWEVVCDNECDFTGPAKDTKEQAVEAWNRRDPDAAKDAEIEAANAELARLRRECSDGLDALSDIDDFWEACPYPENRKHLSPAEQISSLDNELNAARDEIEKLKAALKHIAGESGQFGFPWPETHFDYPAFALLTARAALKGDAS